MNDQTLHRWRLILGRYSQDQLSCQMNQHQSRLERALDYLYSREYTGRGVRQTDESQPAPTQSKPAGSLDPSQFNVPTWLNEVRELFPHDTCELIEKHALTRYGLTELVTDPQVLEKLEPNLDLLKMILTFRGQMKGQVLEVARKIVRQVIEDIKRKLEADIRLKLLGKLNRFQASPLKIAQNLDWRGTIRRNLKHYDPERKKLLIQQVRFFSRVERHLPWTVILCVDQSGSMVGSVIHSAVMAGILAGLPAVKVHLVVFDTSVVDLTDRADDPVETLMSVQLGGGTDIGQALHYCEQLVDIPHRTVLVLVSDFAEGASPTELLAVSRRLREAGVLTLGLASLDEQANPFYDHEMANQLAETGMHIAAMTPTHLAEWLAKRMKN
ncbi:MAG: VWA domain-containing protein [Acidobacteria bacterium]|nr:VWA domain-containing protein [Acidobacteriota bacterium]